MAHIRVNAVAPGVIRTPIYGDGNVLLNVSDSFLFVGEGSERLDDSLWRLSREPERNQPVTLQERIDAFLAGAPHAVVGASRDRSKYGNKVLRAYLQNDREVYPVNPNSREVEGLATFPDLASLPRPVHGISVITRPEVTESIVEQAAGQGVKHIWMQPGAESERAVERAEELGINVIAGGPCALVTLRYREE